ncbi:MAG: hypothetical protein ABEJ58_01825 [Halodesulfurarchaeum sp.]
MRRIALLLVAAGAVAAVAAFAALLVPRGSRTTARGLRTPQPN